jgi:hypothetical protein
MSPLILFGVNSAAVIAICLLILRLYRFWGRYVLLKIVIGRICGTNLALRRYKVTDRLPIATLVISLTLLLAAGDFAHLLVLLGLILLLNELLL